MGAGDIFAVVRYSGSPLSFVETWALGVGRLVEGVGPCTSVSFEVFR